MTCYSLVFMADAGEEQKVISFKASDASEALLFAHKEANERSAELWRGEQMLCTIRRNRVAADEFWEIG